MEIKINCDQVDCKYNCESICLYNHPVFYFQRKKRNCVSKTVSKHKENESTITTTE